MIASFILVFPAVSVYLKAEGRAREKVEQEMKDLVKSNSEYGEPIQENLK